MPIEDLITSLQNKTIDPETLPQVAYLIVTLLIERDDAILKRNIDLAAREMQNNEMRKIAGITECIGPCELVERLVSRSS